METTDPKKYAELRKKVEFQVACEEKAYRIVVRLIENPVEFDFFHNSLHFISPNHYSDIVEERAVSKLCGYALCPNTLDKVLKQKYMISTKTNKVYDIEGRKNFCSGKCYKSSMHVEKQISSTPLWTRKSQPPAQFSFLPLDMEKGRVGEEVFLTMADDLKEEIKTIEKMDKYQEKLNDKKREFKSKNEGEYVGEEAGEDCSVTESVSKDRCVYTLDTALQEIEQGACQNIARLNDDDKESLTNNVSCDGLIKRQFSEENKESSGNFEVKDVQSPNSKSSENDQECHKKSKKSSGRNKTKVVSNSQTEYLMKLLDKRKSLLSKMADIQPSGVVSAKQNTVTSPDKDVVNAHGKDTTENNTKSIEADMRIQSTESFSQRDEKLKLDAPVIEKTRSIIKGAMLVNPVQQCENSDIEIPKREQFENSDNVKDEQKLESQRKNSSCSEERTKNVTKDCVRSNSETPSLCDRGVNKAPVVAIIDAVRAWITDESLEYLKAKVDMEIDKDKASFEKQYKALVAKVDAQEKDFDNILGEERMDVEEETQKSQVPDFNELKRETEENMQKVNQFLTGKFTYQVKEKNVDITPDFKDVTVPFVDKYNQMLIRQKIVLDRISKVLPELLTPLQLLVQDVFTELRELVTTFNLTSENILFKPAEWMLVTTILLILLSDKLPALRRSFSTSKARTYFTLILEAVQSDWEHVTQLVDYLLHV